MKEFTCVVCGAKAIDRGSRQDAKCCSAKCNNRYQYKKTYVPKVYFPCEYNAGVACTEQKCNDCGWNPAVENMRKVRLYERASTAI